MKAPKQVQQTSGSSVITRITEEPVDEAKIYTAVDSFKKAIEEDQLEDYYQSVQDEWRKLSNDERMVVHSLLQVKVPGTNVMYKNALKKYLEYTPT